MKLIISENQYKKLQVLSEGQNVKEFIKNLLSFDDNTIKSIQDTLIKSNFSIDSLKSMFPKVLTPELVSFLNGLNINQAINLVRALYNVFIKNKYNLSEQTVDDYEKELVNIINKIKQLQKNKLSTTKSEIKRNLSNDIRGATKVTAMFTVIIGAASGIVLGAGAGLLVGLSTLAICMIVYLIIATLPPLIKYFKGNRNLKHNLSTFEKDLETYRAGSQNQNSVNGMTKN
jgi:hypothetical protein